MIDDAETLVNSLPLDAEQLPAALALFDPSWHPGIVGLVASRLKDRMHRPVVAFAPAEPDSDLLRGSARSVPGFHIRDALAAVDVAHPGLIERFGGHAMAAGLSLRANRLEEFRSAFSLVALERLNAESLQSLLLTDGELAPAEFSRELAECLRLAGPWGQGFADPVFDNVFAVAQWRVLGERHLKMSLVPEQGGPSVSAIHFGGYAGEPPPARIHAAYQLELDDYRGRPDIQLLIRQWQPA
jgi:single-stranded-DNA-specific exonuclease